MEFQAELPNELGPLIHRDAIPIQSVGLGFRFVLVLAKNADFCPGSGGSPGFGFRQKAHYPKDITEASLLPATSPFAPIRGNSVEGPAF